MTTRTLTGAESTPTLRGRVVDPVVMCAADDAYAMPLAVTLTSAARHLSPSSRLQVYLLDAGIGEANWNGLKESLACARVDLERVPADVRRLAHLPTSHHISHTAFVRLLAAQWLPEQLDRVLYLDSDLLVRDDLCRVWETDLEGACCAAVPDIACPFIDARQADCNFRRSAPYLATLAPVRNWRQLGLNPAAEYFNSGVMLLDLNAWRSERLDEAFLKCLAENRPYIWCWDQYALNVVLAGRWKALPLRWNQGTHVFEYPSIAHTPLDPTAFREALDNPAVIHFTTEFKPWSFRSRHPHREAFFAALRETAWSDWRPQAPPDRLRRAWQSMGVAVHKRSTIAIRKLAVNFHRPPARTAGSASKTAAPASHATESKSSLAAD